MCCAEPNGWSVFHLSRLEHSSDLLAVQCLDVNAFGEDAVLGCDFTGIVEKVGKNVTSLKVGDRIAGLIWGGE